MKKTTLRQLILILVLAPLLAFGAWCSWQVYEQSTTRSDMMDNYGEVNSIYYGLLSVNNWRDEVKEIIVRQIEDFELSPKQDSLLRKEVSTLLHKMIDQAKYEIENNDKGVRKTLRKWAVNAVVDWESMRKQVPGFTETIVQEVTSEDSKERLKSIALEKVEQLANQVYDDSVQDFLQNIYGQYETDNLSQFNTVVRKKAEVLDAKTYHYTYLAVGVVLLFLLAWFLNKRYPELRQPLMVMCVLLAMAILLGGLTSPMIEIDARIRKIDFVMLGQHIEFTDQILYYRSKSILQVVHILMLSARIDSKLVGILVFAFSVLLPVSKLISSLVYMFSNAKWRHNSILQWLAFQSGKWSMADVIVVAIFMAYVGFDGILENQLEVVERNSQQLTSIATNLTSLEAGFILFLTFVLFSLILSEILKRVVKKDLDTKD